MASDLLDRAHLRAERDIVARRVRFYLIDPDELEDGGEIPEHIASVHPSTVQNLLDDLWRDGFRPTDADSKNGEIDAKDDNLEDLRSVLEQVLPRALRAPPGEEDDCELSNR